MQTPYVAVIGAANVDIRGSAYAPLIPRDSNPGAITTAHGGVGRNIAHNLRMLDTQVQLLTAFGGDGWASALRAQCEALGIGLDGAVTIADLPTSTYLYITGPDGEMALAVCNADVTETLDEAFLARNLALLNSAAVVVFDGNLAEKTIAYLCENCTAPLFADPVSVAKSERLRPFLAQIHTIKPNRAEAERLTGESEPEAAAKALVARGVKRAYVSCGKDGFYAADESGCIHIPCCPADVQNATGGGDAAMAALCRAYLDGADLKASVCYAAAAGAITAEANETVSPLLSRAAIENKLNEIGGI